MTQPHDTVRTILAQLPELAALLPVAAITRPAASEGVSTTPHSQPPTRLDVVDLLDTREKESWLDGMSYCDPDRVGVLPYLWGWCRDFESDMLDHCPTLPSELPETPTVSGCCEWITTHLDWLETRPQFAEFTDGITRTHRRVQDAVKHVVDAQRMDVPCSRCGAGRLQRRASDRPLWECDACHHLVSVQAVTLRQAAKLLGVPRTTLQRLAQRSALLTPISEGAGRRLYDLGQLRTLVAEMTSRGSVA